MFLALQVITILFCIPNALAAQPRIVKGQVGEIKDFQYLASLIHYSTIKGGATIITRNAVLTAAHCFKEPIKLRKFFVHVGTNKGENLKTGTLIPVKRYLGHPNYNALIQDNDIGIVWTTKKIIYNDFVKPIALPESFEKLTVGARGIAAGWGRIKENGDFPDNFHFAILPIIRTEECTKRSKENPSGKGGYESFRITQNMFCAGYLKGGKDACKSDSGGPYVVNNKLVGIISFGQGCARPKFPGIYTNVARYREWIDDELKNEPVPKH